jgi:hypothetical protein
MDTLEAYEDDDDEEITWEEVEAWANGPDGLSFFERRLQVRQEQLDRFIELEAPEALIVTQRELVRKAQNDVAAYKVLGGNSRRLL